jgi:hypothetical protein
MSGGSASKRKGSSWERDIANHLSELYKEKFIRVQNSGAFVGGKNASRKQTLDEGQIRSLKGDIVPPSSWIHFNCEAKSYADFPFHQLFQGHVKILETWIDQCMEVADQDDVNLLIMKFNRKGKYVAIQLQKDYEKLTFQHNLIYNSINHGNWAFVDYDSFWQNNAAIIKKFSQKI